MSDSIQRIFHEVELSLSPFNDSSLVSRINRGETMATDSLMRHVFTVSSEVCRRSGGRFDPTVSPAVNLWKFGYTGKVGAEESWEPSQAEIDSVMEYVGILACRIDQAGAMPKTHPRPPYNFS
ncbi:MAG: FAD:protein FMN transferase, partial [Muribaculaceae bacterium]|nr:FAD:protein FMN transferase [Muribaculaceae bacterium]